MKRALLLFSLLLLAGCTKKDLAAEVGDYKILKSDVDKKNQVIRLYFPDETRDLGLNQLIDSYVNAAILEKYGKKITPENVTEEEVRIEKESQMPDVLKKIQDIFGSNKEAYRRVFVIPVIADRMIYFELFSKEKSFHKDSLERAARLLEKAQSHPEKMNDLALEDKLPLMTLKLKKEGPNYILKSISPDGKDETSPLANEGNKWHQEIVTTTQPQKIYKNVVDMGSNWMIVKNDGKVKGSQADYNLSVLVVPKEDFSRWLQKEREGIKIKKY